MRRFRGFRGFRRPFRVPAIPVLNPEFVKATSLGFNAGGAGRSVPFTAQAGNKLVLVVIADVGADAIAPTFNTPVGWTRETRLDFTGSLFTLAVYEREATGSEVAVGITYGNTDAPSTHCVLEFNKANNGLAIDQVFMSAQTAVTRSSGSYGTPATTADNELAVAVTMIDNRASTDLATDPTWTNGFTMMHSHGVGNAPANSTIAPSMVVASKPIPLTGTAPTTAFSWVGDTSDETISLMFTLRPN